VRLCFYLLDMRVSLSILILHDLLTFDLQIIYFLPDAFKHC